METKKRMTGFAGVLHLTFGDLDRNEQEVIKELAALLKKKYVSYSDKCSNDAARELRAQKEYDHVYRMHNDHRRTWRLFRNEYYGQLAITFESSEAVFTKNEECEAKNIGYAKYVLSKYSAQWKEMGYVYGTRKEAIDIMLGKSKMPEYTKLPPLNLFLA